MPSIVLRSARFKQIPTEIASLPLGPLPGTRFLLPAGVTTMLMVVAPMVIIIMCLFGHCDIITARARSGPGMCFQPHTAQNDAVLE